MVPFVLLVDDEPDLRTVLSIRLKASGFECETVSNGKEALVRVAQRQPNLIIADLLMPVMDGYELVRRLKSQPATASIPVIVISALPERARQRRAQELTCAHVMQKPFEAHELLETIRRLLAPPA